MFDISQNLYLNFTPEISDGLVVWERAGELDSEIMARDLLDRADHPTLGRRQHRTKWSAYTVARSCGEALGLRPTARPPRSKADASSRAHLSAFATHSATCRAHTGIAPRSRRCSSGASHGGQDRFRPPVPSRRGCAAHRLRADGRRGARTGRRGRFVADRRRRRHGGADPGPGVSIVVRVLDRHIPAC